MHARRGAAALAAAAHPTPAGAAAMRALLACGGGVDERAARRALAAALGALPAAPADAFACIELVALRAPHALAEHWDALVCVRMLAYLDDAHTRAPCCAALAAVFRSASGLWSMALARESRRRAAPFTSLAERLAAALDAVCAALAARLVRSDALPLVLVLTHAFVTSTNSAAHAQVLRAPLDACAYDATTRMLALGVLVELGTDARAGAAWLADSLDSVAPEFRARAWTTLARLVEAGGPAACAPAARAVRRSAGEGAGVLAQLLRHGHGAELFGAAAAATATAAALTPNRVVLADALAPLARTAPAAYPAHLQRMLADASDAVRAAAVRSLGVLAAERVPLDACLVHAVLARAMHDPSLHVRTRAAWTLANWCAHSPSAWAADAALHLAADERTAMHALRAMGPLLGVCGAPAVRALVAALRAGLAAPAPKVRWNAASSLARGAHGATPDAECVAALCDALADRTFKVRLIAAEALADGAVRARVPPGSSMHARIHAAAAAAAASTEADLAHASFTEATVHGHRCRTALSQLMAGYSGASTTGGCAGGARGPHPRGQSRT